MKDVRFFSDGLSTHGAPKGKSKDDRHETLLRWTQCTRSEQVTMFMTKSEMQQFTTDKGIYSEMKWSRSVKLLRQDLASLLSRLEYGDYDEAVDVEEGENGYLSEIIRSAFLPPLKKGREEGQTQYMAYVHWAEKPFLREFFEITQMYDHHTSVSIKVVYFPGCVMHKSRIYLHDSSDGV